jgi:hypothetical protein
MTAKNYQRRTESVQVMRKVFMATAKVYLGRGHFAAVVYPPSSNFSVSYEWAALAY